MLALLSHCVPLSWLGLGVWVRTRLRTNSLHVKTIETKIHSRFILAPAAAAVTEQICTVYPWSRLQSTSLLIVSLVLVLAGSYLSAAWVLSPPLRQTPNGQDFNQTWDCRIWGCLCRRPSNCESIFIFVFISYQSFIFTECFINTVKLFNLYLPYLSSSLIFLILYYNVHVSG